MDKDRKSLMMNAVKGGSGIAIEPILFIIAIVGVLVAAIAVGKNAFTSSTGGEGVRAKSSSIIEIGENLKVGFDRAIGSAGLSFTDVVIDPNQVTASESIFSPMGGGVNPPSAALAAVPGKDKWFYPRGSIPGVGTGGANTDQLAVLNVTSGVCAEINNKLLNSTSVPTADVGVLTVMQSDVADVAGRWPKNLRGRQNGCLNNSNAAASGYYFYQVIGIR